VELRTGPDAHRRRKPPIAEAAKEAGSRNEPADTDRRPSGACAKPSVDVRELGNARRRQSDALDAFEKDRTAGVVERSHATLVQNAPHVMRLVVIARVVLGQELRKLRRFGDSR